MKKMKIHFILIAFLAVLTACGKEENTPDPIIQESVPPSEPTATPFSPGISDSAVPEIPVEDDAQPPREGMVRSRLTNEWVDSAIDAARPLAVLIPNESSAIPHYNLSKASILYEANVEGRMTRLMAIYDDWRNLEKIGNIRSLRSYYAYWAFEWDAFIVHMGGPFLSMN